MQSAILVPTKGCLVRDPVSFVPLLQEGQEKNLRGSNGRYWKRRIRDGSVIIKKNKIIKKIIEKPVEKLIKKSVEIENNFIKKTIIKK